MSTMAKKSFRKRIKVTKTGKLMRRTQGISHAKANKRRKTKLKKKNPAHVSRVDRGKIAETLKVPARQE